MPMFKNAGSFVILSFFALSSSTSQLHLSTRSAPILSENKYMRFGHLTYQTILLLKNSASALASQTMKCAARSTSINKCQHTYRVPHTITPGAHRNSPSSAGITNPASVAFRPISVPSCTPGCALTTLTSGHSAATHSAKCALATLLVTYPLKAGPGGKKHTAAVVSAISTGSTGLDSDLACMLARKAWVVRKAPSTLTSKPRHQSCMDPCQH